MNIKMFQNSKFKKNLICYLECRRANRPGLRPAYRPSDGWRDKRVYMFSPRVRSLLWPERSALFSLHALTGLVFISVLFSAEVPARLCRIRGFCAAAGGKRHRHVEAAAHHRPLHLLHRTKWVQTPIPVLSHRGYPAGCWPHTWRLYSVLSPSQLTWRSAVKTRWWGWCPAGSSSAGCLSATGYWTSRSCRPSNSTTWKISVSITDPSRNHEVTNVPGDISEFYFKASTWQDAIWENQMWNIVSWAVSQTPARLDVLLYCFDYFFNRPVWLTAAAAE